MEKPKTQYGRIAASVVSSGMLVFGTVMAFTGKPMVHVPPEVADAAGNVAGQIVDVSTVALGALIVLGGQAIDLIDIFWTKKKE
jgi:hypothetical protein